MTFATVGTSWICECFISAAKKQGWVLTAVYSRDPARAEAFGEKHGAPLRFSSLEEMAKSGAFETAYVASPNALHFEQSLLFLRHGKHVFCEKPMTTTLAQAQTLFAEADRRGLLIAEAIMSLHVPAMGALRDAVKRIGRISAVNLVFCQRSSRYPAFLAGALPNIFDPKLHAGCLMDIGVYAIYLAAALFGAPERVCSSASFLRGGADGAGAALFVYPTFTAALTWSKTGQSAAPSEIVGDAGSVSIASVSQIVGVTLNTAEGPRLLVPDGLDRDTVMGGEAAFFADAVKNGGGAAYEEARALNLLVRRLTDAIRAENGFPF